MVALADERHFGRAADRMGISQPALSAAIRHIEVQMGIDIFKRTTHRVDLTEAGAALMPHARRFINTANNTFDDMIAAAQGANSLVRIGVIPSVAMPVASVLASIRQSHPHLRAGLVDGRSDVLLGELVAGALDFVVSLTPPPSDTLTTIALASDAMHAAVLQNHRLAARQHITWQALAGEEIVHFPGGGIGELCSAALMRNGLRHSEIYATDQIDSLFALVRSGLAVGILPKLYTRLLTAQNLAFIPLIEPVASRDICVIYRSRLLLEHPPARIFRDVMINLLVDTLQGGVN
jgi:DNA-binding transcriptional LysR family regulator